MMMITLVTMMMIIIIIIVPSFAIFFNISRVFVIIIISRKIFEKFQLFAISFLSVI